MTTQEPQTYPRLAELAWPNNIDWIKKLMPRGTPQTKKGNAQQASVEAANNDLEGLDLDGLDFSGIPDPDAVPDIGDGPEVLWEEEGAPEVPGEEDLGLDDLGVPGDDAMGILAEYLPPLRASIETLVGQVGDYHGFMKKREESFSAALKAVQSDLASRVGVIEDKQQEILVLLRQLVQGTAPAATAETVQKTVAKEAKEPKAPPAVKTLSPADVQKQLKLPKDLPTVLKAIQAMGDGKELTVAAFQGWLAGPKVGYSADQAAKVVELLKVKGPINNKTFQ